MKSGEEHYKDYLDYLEKNDKQGLGLSLMASAFAGYAQGQATLGRYHLLGEVFPKDLENALNWLEKAAAQDYAPAMTALAAMYMFGDGVKVNGKKAVELLTKAIDGRHRERAHGLSGENAWSWGHATYCTISQAKNT